MWEPAWKQLVEQLNSQDFESEYLDRLNAKIGAVYTGRHDLEKEIIEEMAYALRRSAAKVEVALLRLEVLQRDDMPADSEERCEYVRRYNELRSRAFRARWELIVHREAIGLTNHSTVKQLYPIPAPIQT